MAARATTALASAEQLFLADLVLADCVYVLESFYEVERAQVAEMMRAAIALPAVSVIDASLLLRALEVSPPLLVVLPIEVVNAAEGWLVGDP
jgi:hypothetical protein